MNIAIYGGSFNPPHLGHREAALTALEILHPDRLLIIPDNDPPHKELESGSPTPEERLKLCELTFGDLEGVEISPIEIRRRGKSYTYDTIRELEIQNPGSRMTLLLGTDMLLSFEEWYHFEYLMEHCALAVFARELDDDEPIRKAADTFRMKYGAEIRILPHTPFPISSTELRSMLNRRVGSDALCPVVYGEIIRKRFYSARPELSWLREQAYALLDEWRIAHVAGCEMEAIELARQWGEDPETAAEAAILHDITKRLSYEEQLNLCKKYDIICDNAELAAPKILHAKTGAALAKDRFGVPDEVYRAIRWHTTGKPDMTLLEKIIFLADYIEPTRAFEGIENLRKLAFEDLDRAILLGLTMTVSEIRENGNEPYVDTLDACAWYEALISERRG